MILMTFSISNGEDLDTQALEFDISCVGSIKCPCPCNYATDINCGCRDVNQTLTVKISKSDLMANYPIRYVKPFNYKLTEVIVPTQDCKDGDKESKPTCEWYMEGGKKVPDSQGFCCECSSEQMWDDTFGSSSETTRANLKCGFFDSSSWWKFWQGPEESAHCLKFDKLWYEGFDVLSPQLSFEITLKLNYTEVSTEIHSETIIINPSEPHKRNSDNTVEFELLGDLGSYKEIESFNDKLLMVPFYDDQTPEQALTSNQDDWMLMDKYLITFDGSECDKVGTSFSAFRFQKNRCERPSGTCLKNQLYNFYEEDKDRINKGNTPKYRISKYNTKSNITYEKNYGSVLAMPVNEIRNSLVSLSIKADDIRFVENSSPGLIMDAELCKFNNISCGYFEALSEKGYLNVEIRNIGLVDSVYTITVSKCNWDILEIPAQKVSITASSSKIIPPFYIYVNTPNATSSDIYCWIDLFSSQGIQLDSKKVTFSIQSTILEEKFVNENLPGSVEYVEENQESKLEMCIRVCPNIFNLWCLLWNFCWNRIGRALIYMLLIIIGINFLFVALKRGWIVKFLACFIEGFGSSFQKSKKKKKYKKRKYNKKKYKKDKKRRKGKEKKKKEKKKDKKKRKDDKKKDKRKGIRKKKQKKMTDLNKNLIKSVNNDSISSKDEDNNKDKWEYINVSIYEDISFLENPGPVSCLAGKIQEYILSPDLPSSIVFTIPKERNKQKMYFEEEEGKYEKLKEELKFDQKKASIVLDKRSRQKYVSLTPKGVCLN